jgi:CspA family cold shock protein
MSVISKLVISLVIAGIATAIITVLGFADPIQIGIVIALATCASVLLGGNSPARSEGGHASVSDGDREEGTVKWFNVSKGFGFIIRPDGEEIFVHFRSIIGADKGRRSLRDGQSVSYVVVDSDKGPQAEEVEPLDS